MSISAFYRTWVPVVGQFTYMDKGRPEIWYSPVVYIKGNIQPWKKGELIQPISDGVLVLTDYNVLYTHYKPEFDLSDAPDEELTYERTWAFHEGKWWDVQGNQNWTKAGRAVKHYKWFMSAQTGDTAPELPEPIPFGELVDSFGQAVRELQQTSFIIEEQLN